MDAMASSKPIGPSKASSDPSSLAGAPASKRQRTDESSQETLVVENFLCPISLGLPADPVVGSDGRLYERLEIERWLATKGTSPVTQAPMAASSLVSCHPVRAAIEALVLSGAVAPDEEALFQLRRGKLLQARGDKRSAMACFRRASELGNADAKYSYAVGLLEEAAPLCVEAAQLVRRSFRDIRDFSGHYCTTFCDELIEIHADGTVLFNGERHPDNVVRRRGPDARFTFNQWELDLDASDHGRLLWLRPSRGDTVHRIWWFAYDAACPPNCYEQRLFDAPPISAIAASPASA
mmetsp:Transcript_11417/g.36222  ORF Transcript_11417/g.36222 Transcript_11417/m.36222 type:complete len:294 (+) Transcript_11417:235-1116(+)